MNTSDRQDIAYDQVADVVIIGGGVAGLSAALTAAELGRSVVVLEKQPQPGGSSAMSGGFFAFCETDEQRAHGVSDSRELFLTDLREVGGHRNDEALLAAYLDRQEELYRWLKRLGVTFPALELSSGQSVPRSHHTPPRPLLALLTERLLATGHARILTEHRAVELERADGRVHGVLVESPAGPRRFGARGGVIVTSGGFSRSSELLGIFAPAQTAALPYGGAGNTGDGLRMAWKLGAGFRDMGWISATYGSHPETGVERHELLCAYYLGAIIVNTNGRRFVDESHSYKLLGDTCLRQPEGLGFQIFDSQVRERSEPGVPLSDIDFLEDKGRLFKGDTLAELAAEAGLDPAVLTATVEHYNAAVRGEVADEFGRDGLCNHTGRRGELTKGPFYAYPAKALMTSTYCGLTITANAEVTDVRGAVIEGLYAAGEVTGGFHGVAYMTGTSLGKGALFGRTAGREAAGRVPA
ncbi:FAD-dependent oxidoreductase [Streptomyces sp. NPDC096057]|uniref:FAD-dependent oxidoreductase n=1 Tax=Streptomyces sp. NPDC096057 TaxID=3155543 RepID=UPI0033314050